MTRSGSEGEPVLINASVDEHVEEQTGSYQDCKDDRQSRVIDGSGDPQHQGADSQDDQQQGWNERSKSHRNAVLGTSTHRSLIGFHTSCHQPLAHCARLIGKFPYERA